MNNKEENENWDLVVRPKTNLLSINLKEVWAYKDLILLLVKRDFVTGYKQTLLGPVWVIAQPIMTTIMFTITFSKIANIQTQGIPAFLYYLTGLTFWNYFADGVNKNANTFSSNASIFGKVYFPRLVMPFSVFISNCLKLSIQLFILIIVWLYFLIQNGSLDIHAKAFILLPVVVFTLGIMGLSIGLIVTSLTTKYRDFNFLIGYVVQFLMYMSCIVLALPSQGLLRKVLMLNPIVPLIESIKYMFFGVGYFSMYHIVYSIGCTGILFLIAVITFNKTEKTFMDTV